MKLVILAGGKGTRMGVMTESIPKPMVPLMQKPILEHQINFAKKYGFDDIIISTGYMGDVIRDYFKDGKEWGVHIQYSPDPFPLGTAGAVKHLEQELKDDFVLFYGDTIMDIDLNSLVQLHVKKKVWLHWWSIRMITLMIAIFSKQIRIIGFWLFIANRMTRKSIIEIL